MVSVYRMLILVGLPWQQCRSKTVLQSGTLLVFGQQKEKGFNICFVTVVVMVS